METTKSSVIVYTSHLTLDGKLITVEAVVDVDTYRVYSVTYKEEN